MEHTADSSIIVYVTEDYSRFKKLDANRDVIPNHIKKLAMSLLKKNLVKYRPVIVNKKMEVYDGQNTLQAAIIAKQKIWYVIADDMEISDIPLMHPTRKDWVIANHLHFWASLGNELFKRILEFCNVHGITPIEFLALSHSDGAANLEKIRNGSFRINAEEAFADALDKIEYIKQVSDKVKLLALSELGKPAPQEYTQSPSFKKSVMLLLECKAFNRETFLKRISSHSQKIRYHNTIGGFFELFKGIHNMANDNPIYIGSKDLKKQITKEKKKRLLRRI